MQTKAIVIQPSNLFPPLSQQRVDNLDLAFCAVTSLVTLLLIGISICAVIPTTWHYSWQFNLSKKIPCRRCQYFNDNQFLKCTLHPATALTNQSVDCRDYCSNNNEKTIKEHGKSDVKTQGNELHILR